MSVRRLLLIVGFTFLCSFLSATNPPPALSSISPVVGSTNGGTAVTFSGSNFLTGATVTFGGISATSVVVTSSNTITAVTPANPAGPVNVTVTNPDGQSATLAVVLAPLSNPGFESGSSGWIWNSSGAATIVTNSAQAHSGNNFLQLTSQPTNLPSYGAILGTGSSWSSQFLAVNPGDKITFGGWIARVAGDGFARWTIAVADSNQANSTYISTANITASAWTFGQATYTIPAGKAFVRFYAEVYNNTIPAQSNFDDAILQRQLAVGGYTYLAPPTLTSISPNSGSAAGGAAVTLTGSNFVTGASVTIGGVAATNVTVVNGTTITATTPANSPGTANVTITNPDADSATLSAGFTYLSYPPPTLSSIAPASGSINGGTAVTLAGSNFLSGATVKFGSAAATSVVVVNSGQITAVTPANSAGAVNVTVTNPDAQFSTLNSAYTYNPPPGLVSASPSVGSTNGGTSVTLSGSNFLAGATVTFNSSAATNIVVTNSSTITATAPANPAGPVNVTVTNPDGQGATLVGVVTPLTNAGFELGTPGWAWNGNSGSYAIVTNSSQAHGGSKFLQLTSQAGNHPSYNAVLSGTSQYLPVSPGDIITYGGWIARLSGDGQAHWALQVVDSNKANAIYVSTPNATASTWTLFQQTYTVPSGKAYVRFYAEVYSNTTTAQVNFDDAILQQQVANAGFTYDPPPTVTSIAPNSGVPSGGTAVSITGTNFFSGATVTIGGVAATNVDVVNSTTITATTPSHSSGTVNVVVTNADGDAGTLSAGYTYVLYPPPSLTGVSPAGGSTNGGTAVTLTGSNFVTGATVKFGSAAAISVVVVNSGSITAFTPAGAAGAATVTVTNPDGQSSSLSSAFTYALPPALNSISPVIGPVGGGTSVTLSGSNFKSGATVTFGGVAGTNVVVVSNSTLTVTAPNNALGAATVVVTNPDGQTSALQPVGNPGFEMGNAGWSFNGSGSESIITSSTQAHGGNNFAQLKSNAGNHPILSAVFTGVNSSYLPVNPGDVITFGGWVSRVGGDGSARWSLQVSDVNQQNPVYVSTPNVTANTWTFNQQTFVIPSNGRYIRFFVEIYNNSVTATAYFDDGLFLRTTPGQVFTYITNPTLGWIGPNSGPANTATPVYISGANFVPGATVKFGGAQATNVTVVNSTTITATSPAGAAGSVAVTVTNPYSLTSTSSLSYRFNPPPFINAVSPVTGPPGGGNKITVSGGNFLPGAKMTLGGIPALSVTATPGSISGLTPAQGAGVVDVVVTNPDGQTATASGAYSYSQPAPSIAAITPASGSTNGGTLVVISGANFLASPTVTFGSVAGTVISVSSSAIYVTTPAISSAGAVNVTVVNSDTQSASGAFTYVSPTPAPTITSLSSPTGSTAGGASIVINGTNFVSGATVTFGGVSASNVSVANSTTINASTPPHAPGTVNVTVTNPDAQSATLYGVIPLLPNAGFETGSADWVFAGTGNATVLNDPANAETGNEYALLTGAGTFAAYYATDSSGTNQFFPVSSGDVISFGGSAYRLAGDGQANYTLSIYDANKSSLGSVHTTPNNAATPIWAHMLGSYTVPSNAAYV
ncbi:MAG TPA: IPT/TIG domain-containing protein, partial [Candidatus Sulfotelmatobacter sp.]|nr:IPT/TIG domain-containing protein [Candidatus Sulfotelmatobacter sp.]